MECKICNRKFANGKAVGGHMRSHFATLPLPPKVTEPPTDPSSSLVVCDERESGGAQKLKQKKSPIQSESGSRCKRAKGDDDQPLMTVEEAASCLIMLSRDEREKIYKCDMCERIFKSAQGLGSHKSNHHNHRKQMEPKLDLNLPPPETSAEDEEFEAFW